MKECKRHKWRVGSGVGEFINKKLITTKLNIWCEKCSRKIKASYFSDYELSRRKKTNDGQKRKKRKRSKK